MDCNKDEATRAKEIADTKLLAKDIIGAQKFALKAQRLYPNLDGLSQMMAVIDVYIAAETRINGESDWYGILGVNQFSDDEIIKKQYRKLLLMVHPDKNKSVGADGAFKVISEAWALLSDKTKREAYMRRRFPRTTQQKAPPANSGTSAPHSATGLSNFTKSMNTNIRHPKTPTHVNPTTASSSSSSSKTFWTFCDKCQIQFEFARMYVNSKLLCSRCHNTFLAVEIAAPPENPSCINKPRSSQQCHKFTKLSPDINANMGSASNMGSMGFTSQNPFQANVPFGPFSDMAGHENIAASAPSSAQTTNSVEQDVLKATWEREKKQASAKRQEALRRRRNPTSKRVPIANGCNPNFNGGKPAKKRRVDSGTEHEGIKVNQMGMGNVGPRDKQDNSDIGRASSFSTGGKGRSVRNLSQLETQSMLMEKAREEICKKLQDWSLTSAAKALEKKIATVKGNSKDKKTVGINMDTEIEVEKKQAPNEIPDVDSDAKAGDPMLINVPDPDFHDFDVDRSEKSFADNEIWAAYDDDDGMPRFYAMIHRVISLTPFKICIGWLMSKTNSKLGPLTWVKSGFSKTCGDFTVGKYEMYDMLNSFSHKVRWIKGAGGSVHVYPSKGDVWAIYRNWSPDWNEHTPDEVVHKYDVVEVVDEFKEEQGVSVTPLVKVAGFKTVFRRHFDAEKVKNIPSEEMFRFSHQVPCYLLTGEEAEGSPQGCLELDPASTPLELLQVVTDAKLLDKVAMND